MIKETKMLEAWGEITAYLKDYYADCIYLIITVLSAVGLIILDRKRYIKMLVPVAILSLVIINPLTYKLILSKLVYWRLLWIIPGTLIIGLCIYELIMKTEKVWVKFVVTFAMIGLLALVGKNAFKDREINTNKYRLPQGMVDVCETMLEITPEPRCILPGDMLSYSRQYSPDIVPMYGRNAKGFISTARQEVFDMFQNMEAASPNYEYIFLTARDKGYTFVVNSDKKPAPEELMEMYGYELLKSTGGYNIYYNSKV